MSLPRLFLDRDGLFWGEEHLRTIEVIFKGYPFFGDIAGIR